MLYWARSRRSPPGWAAARRCPPRRGRAAAAAPAGRCSGSHARTPDRRSRTAAPGRSVAAASTPSRRRSGTAWSGCRAARLRRSRSRRRPQHPAEAIGAQQTLCRGLDRRPRAVGLRLERSQRVVGGVGALELLLVASASGNCAIASSSSRGPGHRPSGRPLPCRGRSRPRCTATAQALLGGDRPEVTALDPALVELSGGGQAPSGPRVPRPSSLLALSGDQPWRSAPTARPNGSNTSTRPEHAPPRLRSLPAGRS